MPEADEFDAATIETEKGVVTFDRLPPGLIVSLTMAIARWTRDKTSSEPSPFAGGPQTFLENFLGMLTVRVNAFMRDTAVLFQPEEDRKETADDALRIRIAGYRRTISRMIGQGYTHYRFADLSSRLRFLLDSEGDLATDPFSRWNRQYDIEARLARTSRGNGIVVSLNIPDLLVSGPYYGGILEAVIQSEALTGLVEDRSDDLPAHLALTRAALVACLRKAKISGGAVIARIERAGSGEDLDFLLVRTGASLGATWLLFMFRVSFSHRNIDVPEIGGIGELRLVAAVNRDGEWLGNTDDREELGAYLYRVLLVLYNWRLRFGKAEG
jgi:hypothetical protein